MSDQTGCAGDLQPPGGPGIHHPHIGRAGHGGHGDVAARACLAACRRVQTVLLAPVMAVTVLCPAHHKWPGGPEIALSSWPDLAPLSIARCPSKTSERAIFWHLNLLLFLRFQTGGPSRGPDRPGQEQVLKARPCSLAARAARLYFLSAATAASAVSSWKVKTSSRYRRTALSVWLR